VRSTFRTRARWLAAAAIVTLVFGLSPEAHATNGPKITANGARQAGRGGVDYAYADDGIGPSSNPAGMAFVYGNRLDQYWAIVDPRVTWKNSFGSFDDEDDLFVAVPAFSFGAFFDPYKDWEIAPLFDMGSWGLKKDGETPEAGEEPAEPAGEEEVLSEEELTLGSRLRIGFGVFPVTGGKIQLKDMRTSPFRDPLDWEVDTLSLAITPSFAFRVSRYFSVGMNLQFHYSKFELDGGIAQPRALLADSFEFAAVILNNNPQLQTKADIDDAFTYGFSHRIGLMFHSDKVSVAAVYQDRTYSADYLGRATVDATDEVNNLTQNNPGLLQIVDPRIDPSRGFVSEYDLRIQGYEFPRQFGLGVAVRPHPRFSIGLDYTFIRWSEFFHQFRTRLSHGDNPNLDIMTQPSIPVRLPLKYRDQHVLAVGLTALVAEGKDIVEGVPSWGLVLRAGFNHGRTPARRRTTIPQLPVINENHASFGFSFLWGPLVELSASFEYQLPKEFSVGPHVGDFSLANSKQEVEILFFQVGMGVNF
jgi:long-subunit fatty acid transport protein